MYKIILIILLLPIESVIMSPLRPYIGIHVFFFFIPSAQCYWRVINFITFFKEPAFGFIFFIFSISLIPVLTFIISCLCLFWA